MVISNHEVTVTLASLSGEKLIDTLRFESIDNDDLAVQSDQSIAFSVVNFLINVVPHGALELIARLAQAEFNDTERAADFLTSDIAHVKDSVERDSFLADARAIFKDANIPTNLIAGLVSELQEEVATYLDEDEIAKSNLEAAL